MATIQELENQVNTLTATVQAILDNAKETAEFDLATTPLEGSELVRIVDNGVTKSVPSRELGGNSGEATNNQTIVYLNNINGQFTASPINPIESDNVLFDLSGIKGGGTVSVYYKNSVLLTKDNFIIPSTSGAKVVAFNTDQKVDELCFIWIAFDKGNNAFHVNIVGGYTGAVPTPPEGNTAPTFTIDSIRLEDSGANTAPTFTIDSVILTSTNTAPTFNIDSIKLN